MANEHHETLWRHFPATLPEFEERFATEDACREYLAQCRWGGPPRCARCDHAQVWVERSGTLYQCAACGHQTSLTSGTLFHRTRKPLKLWFRAIWEVCVHRQGISAADLQRILGFGSYETAWAWLHRIRRALVRSHPSKLSGVTQLDETFIKDGDDEKTVVLVAVEEGGRVRLMHAPGNHEACIQHCVDAHVETHASVKTDGHAAYNAATLGTRAHAVAVQTTAQKKADGDHVQLCHWNAAGLKRWLLSTHFGAVRPKHLQSYLDEHAFRYNRRKTKGVGRLVARCLEIMLAKPPLTLHQLINDTNPCRAFNGIAY